MTYMTLYRYKWPRGTRWRSWLRHCDKSRKVAGSNPDCVIGTFHWHKPSDRTMALRLTQPLTEMSTRNISWGKGGRCVGLTTLTTFMCRLSWNLGASTSWKTQDPSRPLMGLLFYKWPQILTLCNPITRTHARTFHLWSFLLIFVKPYNT